MARERNDWSGAGAWGAPHPNEWGGVGWRGVGWRALCDHVAVAALETKRRVGFFGVGVIATPRNAP